MSATIVCDEPLLGALRREGLDSVEGAFAYSGGEDLTKPGLSHRRRTRVSLTDEAGVRHELYLKRYGAEPLKNRLRRRLTYGRRRSPAGVEFENIQAARAAGVQTMRPVAFGQELGLLGAKRSYLIATAVPGEALERCFEDFLDRHGCGERTAGLTRKLAAAVRALHSSGYAHRDLYAAHIFLDEGGEDGTLYVIDLARMFRPRWRRFRWRVKDLAQLKYSMPARWVEGCWDAFLSAYGGGFGAAALERYRRAADRKAAAMRRRSDRKRRSDGSEMN